jgi:pilus assembly protein CpaE
MTNLAYDHDIGAERGDQHDMAAMQALRPIPRISIQAFCESEGVSAPVQRAGEDRRMSKAHLKVHMGGISTAIDFYQTAPTPNLIILESRSEPGELLEQLAQLAEHCDPSTKVVVMSSRRCRWPISSASSQPSSSTPTPIRSAVRSPS